MFILLNGILPDTGPADDRDQNAVDLSRPASSGSRNRLEASPGTASNQYVLDETESSGPQVADTHRLVCECGETYSRTENLARHVRSKHAAKTPWVCAVCSRVFNRSDLLKRHRDRLHPDHPATPTERQSHDQAYDDSQSGHRSKKRKSAKSAPPFEARPIQLFPASPPATLSPEDVIIDNPPVTASSFETDLSIHSEPALSNNCPAGAFYSTSAMYIDDTFASNIVPFVGQPHEWAGQSLRQTSHPDEQDQPLNEGSVGQTVLTDTAFRAEERPEERPTDFWASMPGTSSLEMPSWNTSIQWILNDPSFWQLAWPQGPEIPVVSKTPLTPAELNEGKIIPAPNQSAETLDRRAHCPNGSLPVASRGDSGNSMHKSPQSRRLHMEGGEAIVWRKYWIDQAKFDRIKTILAPGRGHGQSSRLPLDLRSFNHCISQYFQHFHAQLPVLHLPTFSSGDTSPLLLASICCTGACFSALSGFHMAALEMIQTIRRSLAESLETGNSESRDVSFIHAYMLTMIAGIFTGDKRAYELAEASRGTLINLCRRSALLNSLGPHQHRRDNTGSVEDRWKIWIALEGRKRLGVAIYLIDTMFPSLFDVPAYSFLGDLITTALPCDDSYWEAPSARAWSAPLGLSPIPPSPLFSSCAETLRSQRVNVLSQPDTAFPRLNDFSALICVSAIHHRIFDFRAQLCLSLSAEMTSPPYRKGMSPQISGDFALLQKELRLALESWREVNYDRLQVSQLSASAKTLYHLGHVALSVYIADLYSAIGRGRGAEGVSSVISDLREWAVSLDARSAIHHSLEILKIQSASPTESLYFSVAVFVSTLCIWAFACHAPTEVLSQNLTIYEAFRLACQSAGYDVTAAVDRPAVCYRMLQWGSTLLARGKAWRIAAAFATVLTGQIEQGHPT